MKNWIIASIALGFTSLFAWSVPESWHWEYEGMFNEAVTVADRVEILDNKWTEYSEDSDLEQILVLADQEEIDQFNDLFQVKRLQIKDFCYCHGFPVVRWYAKDKLVAQIGIHHCKAFRSDLYKWDVELDGSSTIALLNWMVSRGIHGIENEFINELERRQGQQDGARNGE